MKVMISVLFVFLLIFSGCSSTYFQSLAKKDYVPYTLEKPINDENIAQNITINRDGHDKKIYIRLVPRRMKGEFDLEKNQYLTIWPYVSYDLKSRKSEYRLRIQYDSYDLLLINSFIASCENRDLKIKFDYFKERHFELHHSGGYVREWFDKKISQKTIDFFKECKKDSVMVLTGKDDYYEEPIRAYNITYFHELEYIKRDLDDEKIMRLEDFVSNGN